LFELVTVIAFKDIPESEGTMAAYHALVNCLNSSTQAMQKFLAKQREGHAIKLIQDVATRWWSTYSMCEHLL